MTGMRIAGTESIAKALEFGYANARVKAMKQGLLSEKELDSLAEAKSLDEVYALLEKTPYREDLVAVALKERTLADRIEFAATKNFSRTLKKIVKISPEKARKTITEMFEKYDLNNIKTILISRHLGEAREKTEPFIMEPVSIPRGKMNKMADAKSVREALNALAGTEYAGMLEKHYGKYERTGEISVLLFALDDYYYSKLPGITQSGLGDERIILGVLRAQADIRNISNACRAVNNKVQGEEAEKLMIRQGNLPLDALEKACRAKSVEEAVKIFEKYYPLSNALGEHKKTGSLIPIEMELERIVAGKGLKALRNSVLSLGSIAGFLFLKEEEVNNIRKIVRGKEFNLPNEKIREMMVVV